MKSDKTPDQLDLHLSFSRPTKPKPEAYSEARSIELQRERARTSFSSRGVRRYRRR